METARDRGKV